MTRCRCAPAVHFDRPARTNATFRASSTPCNPTLTATGRSALAGDHNVGLKIGSARTIFIRRGGPQGHGSYATTGPCEECHVRARRRPQRYAIVGPCEECHVWARWRPQRYAITGPCQECHVRARWATWANVKLWRVVENRVACGGRGVGKPGCERSGSQAGLEPPVFPRDRARPARGWRAAPAEPCPVRAVDELCRRRSSNDPRLHAAWRHERLSGVEVVRAG